MSPQERDEELQHLYEWAGNLQEELDSLKDHILELADEEVIA